MLWLWLTTAALAQDEDWGEGEDDIGFGGLEEPVPVEPASPVRPVTVGGTVRHDEALWVERLGTQPWAKGRFSLDLYVRYKQGILRAEAAGHAEVDPAPYVYEDTLDEATVQTYGRQLVPRELFVAVSPGAFEIVAGRQIVGWGEGTLVSPVDVVNPRDLREPGLNDIDEVRLPVTLLRLGWFRGDHRVELMGMPESDFGFRSPPNGLFGPLEGLLEDTDGPLDAAALLEGKNVPYVHRQERWDLENSGLFGRWLYQGSGLDAGLYAASTLDRTGVFDLPTVPENFDPALLDLLTELEVTLDHRRTTMVGGSVVVPQELGLLKAEVALDLDRPFNVERPGGTVFPDLGIRRADLLQAMLGLQYTGFADTTLDLELGLAGFVDGRPDGLVFPADAPTVGARLSRVALKERLRVDAMGLFFGTAPLYGAIGRLSATYELRDGWHATLGGITYQPGEERGPLLGLDTHDRVYAQVRWDFTAL